MTGYVNTVLDRAERMGWWYPAFAGFLLGSGIDAAIFQSESFGWALLAAGIALSLIRPAGTSARRRHRIRQVRNVLRFLGREKP